MGAAISHALQANSIVLCTQKTLRNVLHTNEMNCDAESDPRRVLQSGDETSVELLAYAFTYVSFK